MTKREYLYTVLMEEAAEVSQAVSKILRFGEKAYCPADEEQKDNEYNLLMEIEHLAAAIDMLQEEGILRTLDPNVAYDIQANKAQRVRKYLNKYLNQQEK